MQSLTRILKSTSALWPYYIAVVITSTATAALALATPFILRSATDTIVSTINGSSSADEVTPKLAWLAIGLLAAELTHTLVYNLGGWVGDVMAFRMRQILSTRYFAKLLSLPQRYFDDQVTGTIIARLDRSIMSITQFVQAFSNNFFSVLLTTLSVLVISGWFYWPLALLLAIIFPLYLWLTSITSKKWQVWEGEKNKEIDAAGGRFAEVVGQVKVVKSFVSEARELAGFGRRYARTVDTTRDQSRYWHRMDVLRGAALNLIFFGIYALLFYRTLHGEFSLGDMVLLLQLINMAKQPVLMLSFLVDASQRAVTGSREYFKVMGEIPEHTANKQLVDAADSSATPDLDLSAVPALQPLPNEPVIAFDHVSFGYNEEDDVIHDVSFAALEGQRVALVGESGGGKSTLVNLLLGLYRPRSGHMSVCGRDVDELDNATLRASVGVVFQEASLFSGTVRENIAYGRPDATDAEVEDAARRANADEFISHFPDGYDTLIGERGLRLSGGQKQRVAVARAILKDAPVLVLDEATSALDTKAERAVQRGLDELMHNRTTLIIAHRLSTIATVDTIVTLRNGRVDEVGSPAELAQSGGIYAELLALTASDSAENRKRLKDFGFHVDAPAGSADAEASSDADAPS